MDSHFRLQDDDPDGRIFVRSLFNRTAPYYDAANQLFSLGSGPWHRRRCLLRAGLRPGVRVIDVATGTGLVAQEAVRISGDPCNVIGVDLSEAMLAAARKKLAIPLIQGSADCLPIANETADFVTMGFALRHIADIGGVFREFRRVLRNGGTLLMLEVSRPRRFLNRTVAAAYLGRLVPLLSRWMTGRSEAQELMRYHWHMIDQSLPPERILAAMAESGFRDVRRITDLDLFHSYIGRKP